MPVIQVMPDYDADSKRWYCHWRKVSLVSYLPLAFWYGIKLRLWKRKLKGRRI